MTEPPDTPATELDLIVGIIARHPEGVSRSDLEQALRDAGRPMPWRTLLRRLDDLIAAERVATSGRTRGRRYLPGAASARNAAGTPLPTADGGPHADAAGIPLSLGAVEVRALVTRPLSARDPVGYDVSFLESYEPGKTWYLDDAMRARLSELGRTPDAERPAGTYAREILGNLLIDLSWASSRLEGNRYTRLDTQRLIELGQQAQGKDLQEAQMILNHKRAIELLVEQADLVNFNRYTLLNLHAALSQNLMGDESMEGRLRWQPVRIGNSVYQPLGIPQRIDECFGLLLEKAIRIPDPFEQSFFVMVHLPYLQPFADVNKRTSRLAANISLIKANLRPLSFVDVPEDHYSQGLLGVYEMTRVELLRDVYLWAYERSSKRYTVLRDAMGAPDPIRTRYDAPLAAVIRDVVQRGAASDEVALRAWARDASVPETDVEAFADLVARLVAALHEGNIGRYGIRPSELAAWRMRNARLH